MSNLHKLKKFALSFVLSIFSLATLFGAIFLAPAPANAQWGVATLTDAPRMLSELGAKIKDTFGQVIMTSAVKGLSYFMRKIAYDSAVWLASGGKGQSPFAHTTSFGSYMEQVAGDAAAEAIDTMGKSWGLDLCKMPSIQLDLALRIGLRQRNGNDIQREGRCSFQEMQKGWSSETFNSMYGSDQIGNRFNATLSADMNSDLGIFLKSNSRLGQIVSTKSEQARADRVEGKGFLPLSGMINGDVKTPAAVMEEGFKQNTPDKTQKQSQDEINAVIASGAYQVIPSTLSTFLNTLTSQMLKNFTENGMLPFGMCIGSLGDSSCDSSVANYEGSGSTVSGRDAAQAAFSEFLVAKPTVLDKYDLVPQLAACPDAPGVYNCRIDSDFAEVIKTENFDRPITIEEALASNKLHADWKLIPPTNALDSDKNCFEKNAYCYSNIRVLRQTRILPLGFEIAAKNSDPDHPWSLGDVVKGFYDCNYQKDGAGNIVGVNYDPINKPYCHLIDPRWVLKSPPARCNALTSGASLMMEESPTRLEECVDLSTCVAYNKDGSCLSYGYCAREKNSWRFEADKCDSYNATCKAFTDANGSQVAYLYRTLDTGSCNQNTAGCRAFSLEQNENGAWIDPQVNADTSSPANFNSGIHLNNKVSSPCSAPGCTAFNVETPSGSSEQRYLKKAPDYLKCYDADPTTKKLDIPQNSADLAKIKPRSECSQYAGVCIPSEIGCNWFTSILTGEAIPGKFKPAEVVANTVTWNDQCDARCDGYADYKEMPSNYSNGQEVAYVIPPNSTNNSGATCQPQEESCTGFTNMGESFAGGEKIEYYTYLRPCIKPDPTKQKNFYTYEGADGAVGYQLKSYTLEKDVDGSPKYWARTATELAQYVAECTEDRYKKGLTSADCRQFNDDQGHVYYRLLRQVVVVNDSCTNYRLNSSEFASATPDAAGKYTCFQNGEYRDGFCYYFGLPNGVATTAGQSNGCAKEVESCRAYKGNAANRVRNVFETLTFEDTATALSGWKATGGNMAISAESTQVKGHSLNHSGAGNLEKSFDVKLGKSYVVSFWAKGNQKGVQVNIQTDQTNIVGTVNVSDVWQYYTLTSKDVIGGTASGTLQFVAGTSLASGATQQLYVDNINLKEITDYLYLVKNSLKVDPICDSEPNDNLPGEALGCTGYNDAGKNPFYLTNFSYLCREGAIGCAKMFDTYNTPDDNKAMAYNVELSSQTPGQKMSIKVGGDTFSCQANVGEGSCLTNIKGHTKEEIKAGSVTPAGSIVGFNKSTIYIPPDAVDPMYLVINKDSVCTVADQGCTVAGLVTKTPLGTTYVTTTIKNDPTTYDQTVCSNEAVGCNSYSVGSGSYYFKDPAVTGQKICAYNTKATVNGQTASGWFWKGVGKCSAGTNTANSQTGNDCTKNDDCDKTNNETCQNIGNIPCYPGYIQDGNDYGLWSFGDKGRYENFVGQCPTQQSGCTEYVDKNDKKNEKDKGRSYFFLANDKINAGDCSGLASLKYGCVLFDQVDKPGKLWNTASTYQKSDGADGKKVEPIHINTASDDANTIIKVSADRECGEWLACQDTQQVWDDKKGAYKSVCTSIGRCNQKPETAAQENIYNCSNFMSDQENLYANKVLTDELYVGRKVTWSSQEFSGYSILNSYPVEELEQVNIEPGNTPDWRLVKAIPCGKGENCISGMPETSTNCKREEDLKGNGECGIANSGICRNGNCVQNIDGRKDLANDPEARKLATPKPICRAYPEKTSPFPNIKTVRSSNAFNGANICNEIFGPAPNIDPGGTLAKLAYSCDCDYSKVEYGDSGLLTKYYDYYSPNNNKQVARDMNTKGDVYRTDVLGKEGDIPSGICQGGSKDGTNCASNDDCLETDIKSGTKISGSSICQLKKKEKQYLGWRGYCLEPDLSRNMFADADQHPCLTWLPVDRLSGVPDINNQFKEAGFEPLGNHQYCLKVEKYSKPRYMSDCWEISWQNDSQGNCVDDSNNGQDYCDPRYYDATVYTGDGNMDTSPGAYEGRAECTNDCGYYCKPKAEFKDKWFPNWPYAAKETVVGCEALINVKDDTAANGVKLAAWTQNIWDKSNSVSILPIGVKAPMVAEMLNFKRDTVNEPFASQSFTNTDNTLKPQKFCYKGGDIVAPFSDPKKACPDNYSDKGEDSQVYKISDLFAYDKDWNFGNSNTVSNCDPNNPLHKDADCNPNVTCQSSSGNVGASPCVKECITDNDCNFGGMKDDGNFYDNSGAFKYKFNFCVNDTYCNLAANKVKDVCKNHTAGANYCSSIRDVTCNVTDSSGQSVGSAYCDLNEKKYGGNFVCRDLRCAGQTSKSGFACTKTSDCYDNQCTNLGAYNSCIAQVDLNQSSKPSDMKIRIGNALDSIMQIFARISKNNIMVFDTSTQQYIKSDSVINQFDLNKTSDLSRFDITENGFVGGTLNGIEYDAKKPVPPEVYPVGNCNSDLSKCIMDTTQQGLTVNGVFKENAKIFTNPARATLKFYAFANTNQMPLKNVTIDWGDTQTQSIDGFYRNHLGARNLKCNTASKKCNYNDLGITAKGLFNPSVFTGVGADCNSDADCKFVNSCIPENQTGVFGQVLGQTCDNAYFQYTHVYQCSKDDTVNFKAGSSCPDTEMAKSGGCCVYKPRVQVKDNWDWYNGECKQSVPTNVGGDGCYHRKNSTDEGNLSNGPYTCFGNNCEIGKGINVLVAPR